MRSGGHAVMRRPIMRSCEIGEQAPGESREALAASAKWRQRFDCLAHEGLEARLRGGGVGRVVGVVEIVGVLEGDAEALAEGPEGRELGRVRARDGAS